MSTEGKKAVLPKVVEFFKSTEGIVATAAVGVGLIAGGVWWYRNSYLPHANKPVAATKALIAFLKGDEKKEEVELISKQKVNHDSYLFTFKLPAGHNLGVQAGYHIYVYLPNDKGEPVRKPYTPISVSSQEGSFELLVKIYRDEEKVRHTLQFEKLEVGQKLTIAGPIGKHEYLGHGQVAFGSSHEKKIKSFKQISFVAGGSGITPFLSLIRSFLETADDKTQFTLIYSNKTEDDILHRKELEQLASKKQAKVVFTVTRQNEVSSAEILKGRVTKELLQAQLPAAGPDHLVFHCGPQHFNTAVSEFLQELDHKENGVKF